jgi:hypothetical protein
MVADTHPVPLDDSRLADIQRRLDDLRARTSALATHAALAAENARRTRSAPAAACSHSVELSRVREDLGGVQHELDGLRTAMSSRAVIEQAKGMLMVTRKIDPDAAFAVLVELSQTSHRKLADVAALLVESWRAPEHAAP